jgi:hypothetical protein
LNLYGGRGDIFTGGDFFQTYQLEPDMSKAARAAVAISVPAESSNQSDFNQLVPVALLSGIGLLVSLIVMLSGMQVAWY